MFFIFEYRNLKIHQSVTRNSNLLMLNFGSCLYLTMLYFPSHLNVQYGNILGSLRTSFPRKKYNNPRSTFQNTGIKLP